MQTVYNEFEVKESFKKALHKVKEFVSNDGLDIQNVLNMKVFDACDQATLSMVIDYVIKSEAIAPGAPEIFLDSFFVNKKQDPTPVHFNRLILQELLSTYSKEDVKELVYEALELAGLHGKIVISHQSSNSSIDLVELENGSFFSGVNASISLKSSKFLNPRVICIDGFLESVSEIHRILEDAASSKEIVFIFVRGISDEVNHTLKVNYDRGTLSVIPMVVKYDLDGANLLVDIATVSNNDVVSSLKGQLISAIDIFSFQRVESIDISPVGVSIQNQSSRQKVDRHIFNIQNKINSSNNDIEKEILAKRIQNLGTNRVLIRLTDDHKRKKKSFDIDRCLRAVKSACSYGTAKYLGKVYPLAALKAGAFYYEKFQESTKTIGSVVVES